METLDRHLDAVATRMGGFLREFGNPRVHLGSAARFSAEFRRLMALPAIHAPGGKRMISYSEAAEFFRAPSAGAGSTRPAEPVTTMVWGLSQASVPDGAIRGELPLEALRKDLATLLRLPVLLFYLSISNREAFFARLAEIAARDGFPLVTGEGRPQASGIPCRSCGSALPSPQQGQALKCTMCGQSYESVRALPMVSGVVALVSFEMLRRIVALELVDSYQEEGKIVPLRHGSKIP